MDKSIERNFQCSHRFVCILCMQMKPFFGDKLLFHFGGFCLFRIRQ